MTIWSTHCRSATPLLIALGTVIALSLPMSPTAEASPSTDMLAKVQALLGTNQDKAALALLNELLRKDPKNTQAYCERALTYRKLGQNEKSLLDSTTAVNLDPAQTRPFIERAHTYIHLHKDYQAVDDCTRAIKLEPQNGTAFRFRALAHENLGLYSKAIDDLSSAIRIEPKNADAYEWRATSNLRLGQLQKAISDSTVAARLNPSLLNAYFTAAQAEQSLGHYPKAIEHLTKLIRTDAKKGYAWSYRATLYDLTGKHDLAKSDWQKAFALATPTERIQLQICNPLNDTNTLSAEPTKAGIDKQLQKARIILPFHYDSGGHICVPAQLNRHSIKMMLDTGCGHSDLWKDKMAGIATMDEVQLHDFNAQNKPYSYGWFRAQSLTLGNLTIPNVAMEAQDGLPGHPTLSGFLAGNILENFVVTIDYSKKQIILARSIDLDKSKNAVVVPMWLDLHRPFCYVKLDGKVDVAALLDTGAPSNMAPDTLLQPILSKQLIFDEHAGGPWMGDLRVHHIHLKSVAIGRSCMSNPIFEVYPATEAPVAAHSIALGDSFLSRFRTVSFDYPGRRVFFQPNAATYMSASQLLTTQRQFACSQVIQKHTAIAPGFTKCLACKSWLRKSSEQPSAWNQLRTNKPI